MSIYTYKTYHGACECCTGGSGEPIQVDFAGTNIQGVKIVPVKQRLARSYCFLSLRQFFPETWAGLERQIHAIARDARIAFVLIPSASSRNNSSQPASPNTSRPSYRPAGHHRHRFALLDGCVTTFDAFDSCARSTREVSARSERRPLLIQTHRTTASNGNSPGSVAAQRDHDLPSLGHLGVSPAFP